MSTEVAAVDRARWLAELGDALEHAQRLTWRIGLSDGGNAEAMELYGRLEAARIEVQSLRLGGFAPISARQDPNWTKLLPWSRRDDR